MSHTIRKISGILTGKQQTWIKFAELETLLGDIERARAIFALAVQQPALDMPEVIKIFLGREGRW